MAETEIGDYAGGEVRAARDYGGVHRPPLVSLRQTETARQHKFPGAFGGGNRDIGARLRPQAVTRAGVCWRSSDGRFSACGSIIPRSS